MSSNLYRPGNRVWYHPKGTTDISEGIVEQFRELRGLVLISSASDANDKKWYRVGDISIVDYEPVEDGEHVV